MASRVVIVRGPRAAEARLLAELDALLPCSPAQVGLPVRVVVPSQSLRLHLGRRLVEMRGAVAGVVVQTLYGLALEVLERAGEPSRPQSATYEVLVRRRAGREPALRQALAHLEDGYSAVTASVRDLLDAGLESAHAEPVLEQLGALAGGAVARPVVARAEALVRVAAAAAAEAERLGSFRGSTLLRRAAELVAEAPEVVLPSCALLVHGFADATGLATDLVEAVVRHRGAVVLLDRPLDPVDGSEAVGEFGAPFATRLAGLAPGAGHEPAPAPASLRVVAASDVDGEVRGAVAWAAAALAEGVAAERVAIVARDLGRFAAPLRRHADRLGVPLSGLGAQVPGGGTRSRCLALAELLRERERTAADVWLQAVAPSDAPLDALALGLRCLGAGRLEGVAALRPRALPAEGVELPVVVGWDEEGETQVRSRRRRLLRRELERWVRRARAAVAVLRRWPLLAPVEAHLEASLALGSAAAGGGEEVEAATETLRAVATDLPAGFELGQEEWLLLAGRALERAGAVPLGGQGGGVQVLSAMETRGRTFARLRLLGLNRELFPRAVREDPFLPDELRERLRVVLPELPVKRHGWDEERYLLAELVAAAEEEVVASWHASDAGALVAPSPFADRLRLLEEAARREGAALVTPAGPRGGPRPACEHAVAAGLAGDRDAWERTLAAAVVEGRSRAGDAGLTVAPATLARARRALVDEIDPQQPARGLGPFSGLVGRATAADPRRRDPAVTTLEAVARCPWQAFLTRVLRVELPPDPLFALPAAPASLVGTVVHRVLERVVRAAVGRPASLAEALGRPQVPVPWPGRAVLGRMVTRVAREVAREEGLERSAVVPMLEVLALPFLEMARDTDWQGEEGPPALGAEVGATWDVPGSGRRITLRVDRVDRDGERVVLTDYKTGRGLKRGKLAGEVARGTALQTVAYCLVSGDPAGLGRYLFLSPDPERAPERVVAASADQAELVEAFVRSARTLLAAHDEGAFPPRVARAGTDRRGDWCATCDVAEACLLEDSGYRRRLVAWQGQEPGESAAERAAHAVWWLGTETAAERAAADGEEEP